MLRSDPCLPFRDLAWSAPDMAELFRREVLPRAWPEARLRALRRRYTAYKPGKECLVLYSLSFEEEEEQGPQESAAELPSVSRAASPREALPRVRRAEQQRELPHLALATFGKAERLRTLHDRHYTRSCRSYSAVLLPEYPCLVEFFPSDWKLPELARASDPRGMEAALATADGSAAAPVAVRDVRILRYRPRRRCVLGYGIEGAAAAPRDVIGKLYPPGPKAAQVREKLCVLGPQARSEGLHLPEPGAALDGSALVLMEYVPGTNAGELLESSESEEEVEEAIRVCASALASFHRLRLASSEVRDMEGELRVLQVRAERMGAVAPAVGVRVATLLEAIATRLPELAPRDRTLIHGDYKPSQLLLERDDSYARLTRGEASRGLAARGRPGHSDRASPGFRAAIVDLDRACLGDPAIDLGNFLAVLVKLDVLKGRECFRGLASRFLSEYELHAGRGGFVAAARLFESLALVRMVVRKLERSPHAYAREGAGWAPLRFLDEAGALLAGRGADA